MTKLFLITAEMRLTAYMSGTVKSKDFRLVYATNSEEAMEKYEAYWESQSDSYGDAYTVRIETCTETIM